MELRTHDLVRNRLLLSRVSQARLVYGLNVGAEQDGECLSRPLSAGLRTYFFLPDR